MAMRRTLVPPRSIPPQGRPSRPCGRRPVPPVCRGSARRADAHPSDTRQVLESRRPSGSREARAGGSRRSQAWRARQLGEAVARAGERRGGASRNPCSHTGLPPCAMGWRDGTTTLERRVGRGAVPPRHIRVRSRRACLLFALTPFSCRQSLEWRGYSHGASDASGTYSRDEPAPRAVPHPGPDHGAHVAAPAPLAREVEARRSQARDAGLPERGTRRSHREIDNAHKLLSEQPRKSRGADHYPEQRKPAPT